MANCTNLAVHKEPATPPPILPPAATLPSTTFQDDFGLTQEPTHQEHLLVPGALGRALQTVKMTHGSDGSITPPGSATSTAPGSPRM